MLHWKWDTLRYTWAWLLRFFHESLSEIEKKQCKGYNHHFKGWLHPLKGKDDNTKIFFFIKYLLLDIRLGWKEIRTKWLGPFNQSFGQKKIKKHEKFYFWLFWSFLGLWFFLQKIPKINLLKWIQTRKCKNNMFYLNLVLLRSEIINFPVTHDG